MKWTDVTDSTEVTGIPGEQDGDVMMQGVSIALGVEGFLPLAKTSQGVVGMVADFQILLQKENQNPQLTDRHCTGTIIIADKPLKTMKSN